MEAIKKDAKQEMISYIAKLAQRKTEYLYEKYTRNLLPSEKQSYDKEIQEKLGKEAYQKALETAKQGIPGSLSYLVDGTLEKNLNKKSKGTII